ncbi:Crp/Fnr family transcriptional regulator [Hyphobacterium sp. SN044]|uniref:Crp/Fnr family transcriptional regulator n=1 Tax=Hyphobacterium sp. SN044 TaxID=2912575 RepID=UPI001F392888|nr:Crp/Fnr family transcriptional regulator [Hyphobacterium sp. SN044]MCF8879030.1 Crp/Fnr family transcriptional regulator [Hyphobacterium sp. SN044]
MDALLARLKNYVELPRPSEAALTGLSHVLKQMPRGKTIITEGEVIRRIHVIQKGWAIRKRILEDGRRQIINFLLPGDVFDLQAMIDSKSDHGIETITLCEVRSIPTTEFLSVVSAHPALSSALWWSAVQEEGILREHIVRVGRRNAIERISHLLFELRRRLILTGNADPDDPVALPLSRQLIADAVGLSSVHVSRTVSTMRRMGLVATNAHLRILDPESLASIAGFDGSYLHLDAKPLETIRFSDGRGTMA